MAEILLCPSMMCADFSNLKEEVEKLASAGIDMFHMDFMDGSFVPNFGMGIQDFELVRKTTDKLVDVHLMIMNPSNYIEMFANMGADVIYIHPEADIQPARTLEKIHLMGKKAGLAINPGTSVDSIKELLILVDYVMVMTVNPGFAGQKYLDYVDGKIVQLLDLKEKYTYKVMVDGAISLQKIEELTAMGVEGFILGTSTLFNKNTEYKEIISRARKQTVAGGRK